MAPSSSSSSSLPSASSSSSSSSSVQQKSSAPLDEKERLEKVGIGTKWGIMATTGNMLYGYLMVGQYIPKDQRQNEWLLMRSPFPTYIMTILYVLFVTNLGPKIMRGREPFKNLRPLMVIYNLFQVVFSAWIVYMLVMGGWNGSYSLQCQPCDFSDSPQATMMLHGSYWYYFSKFIDFIDTIFFVLNKKYEHISVLHVVHHSLMPVSMWWGIRHYAGGHSSFMGLLNSFVHVVMYTYYLLAAMGPSIRPYLWWKKYLTSMQMIQFILVVIHSVQLAFIDCPVPMRISWWICGNAVIFLFLFANFYRQSYLKNSKTTRPSIQSAQIVPSKMLTDLSNGISNGVSSSVSNGIINGGTEVNGKVMSNGTSNGGLRKRVADTACETLQLGEKMALKSRLGAI